MRTTIELAGIPIELVTDSGTLSRDIQNNWKGFISKKNPHATIRVISETCPEKPATNTKDDARFSGNIYELHNWFADGRFDFSGKSGEVRIRIEEGKMLDALGRFVRNVWGLFLLQRGMLLMHAAAVGMGRHGYLFLGPSSSGKTTIAGKSSGQRLCDDSVILKMDAKGRPCIIPTMLGGDYPAVKEQEFPLKGAYFIRQSDRLKSRKLTETEAFYGMLNNCIPFMGFERRSPEVFRRLFKLAHSYSSIADCYALESRKEDDVWKVIR